MQSSLSKEIQSQLRRHLDNDWDLQHFRDWFAPLAWSIEDTGDEEAERLVYDIELAFAEYANGAWTTEQLRHELISLSARTSQNV